MKAKDEAMHNNPSNRESNHAPPWMKKGVWVLLLMSSFALSSLAMAAPSTLRIILGTFAPYYSPQLVHIASSTPVSWENPTYDLHTITHDGCKTGGGCAFDSGPLGHNGTFTLRHLPPGHYPYHCTFHPIMQGILVVSAPESPSDT
jgi:plastocyanin